MRRARRQHGREERSEVGLRDVRIILPHHIHLRPRRAGRVALGIDGLPALAAGLEPGEFGGLLRVGPEGPRDAKATNYADRVSYTPGFETEAALIGGLLGLATESMGPLPSEQTVKTPPDVPAFDVQIMVGQDLATKYANQSLTGTPTTIAAATTLPA